MVLLDLLTKSRVVFTVRLPLFETLAVLNATLGYRFEESVKRKMD